MNRLYLNENYNINVGRKSDEIYLTIGGVGVVEAAYCNRFSATVQSKISDQVWERRVSKRFFKRCNLFAFERYIRGVVLLTTINVPFSQSGSERPFL